MMSFLSNIKDRLRINKWLRKSARKNREDQELFPFCCPMYVDLTKWIIYYHDGDPSHVDWLNQDLADYVDEHEGLYMYVAVNLKTKSFNLDEIGIQKLRDVLIKFFGEQEVDNMYEYLKYYNLKARKYIDERTYIETMDLEDLYDYRKMWQDFTVEEVIENLKDSDDVGAAQELHDELQSNILKMIDYYIKQRRRRR